MPTILERSINCTDSRNRVTFSTRGFFLHPRAQHNVQFNMETPSIVVDSITVHVITVMAQHSGPLLLLPSIATTTTTRPTLLHAFNTELWPSSCSRDLFVPLVRCVYQRSLMCSQSINLLESPWETKQAFYCFVRSFVRISSEASNRKTPVGNRTQVWRGTIVRVCLQLVVQYQRTVRLVPTRCM